MLDAESDEMRACVTGDAPAAAGDGVEGSGDGGGGGSSARMDGLRASMQTRVSQGVLRAAVAVRNVSHDAAINHLALDNYVEAVASFAIGREQVHGFLRDCCLRGWASG